MRSRQALQNYLLSVRCLTGADTASLFLSSDAGQRPDFVLHEGVLPPVPELESEALAAQLLVPRVSPEAGDQRPADRPLLHFQLSSAGSGYLLGLDLAGIQAVIAETRPTVSGQCRRPPVTPADSIEQGTLWLGLRYNGGSQTQVIADYFRRAQAFTCEMPDCAEDWMMWTLSLGGYLAWESYRLSALHQDNISQLPGRAEFQACLKSEHEKAVRERYPLALLLVNPDEFGLTNHRLGREMGDAALREVAMQLSRNLRRSDGVFRYGGAVFCILMPATTPVAARAAADKLRQTLGKHGYLDGAARFAFSTGVAVYEP
ncbi:MAG: GGDEF domain-containing protein, partial [Thiogranum sp.]